MMPNLPENLVELSGQESINLDLVRRVTVDIKGRLTLHFDANDKRVLNEKESRQFEKEVEELHSAACPLHIDSCG